MGFGNYDAWKLRSDRDDGPQDEFEPDDEPEPEGLIEYTARCAIRDLVRLYGFEDARELVAMYLNSEADRRPKS